MKLSKAAAAVAAVLKDLRANAMAPKKFGTAFAPSNIALAKYWGKRDLELNLPNTSSLSISLQHKGATTTVAILDATVTADVVLLNNNLMAPSSDFSVKISNFLDLFRGALKLNCAFEVNTTSNIPIASGVASSACGFAALVLALDDLFNWKLPAASLSILARLGSGSAARSIFNGFVEWECGVAADGSDSYAKPLTATWPDLCVGLLLVTTAQKPVSSRIAMQQSVATSPFYKAWPAMVVDALHALKTAIASKDFELLGETAEQNALAMHAIMATSKPPLVYSIGATLELMQQVWALRRDGVPVYFTQDAGPHLKLLFLQQDAAVVAQAFQSVEIIKPFAVAEVATEQVVLVDRDDNQIGTAEKLAAHQQGLLHRAFSVFVVRHAPNAELEILLQQRHPDKYHCGGLWTNTCCSHPRPHETVLAAARRRLAEEMGLELNSELEQLQSFIYTAHFSNGLTEHELDHVVLGFYNAETITPAPTEVSAYKWVTITELQHDLAHAPERYTPWLAEALAVVLLNKQEYPT
jgi:diphosphomevalonate decarboxylase